MNKNYVAELAAAELITPAGQAMIDLAKATGTWAALDDIENLVISADLQTALEQYPKAAAYFEAFPRSAKRGILEWIATAKRAATRQKRIDETAAKAAKNERANQYTRKK